MEMRMPKDAADVKMFVGMVNYVGKFSPRIAELTQPHRDLLKTDTEWVWGSAQQRAFEELHKELRSPTVLAQYCLCSSLQQSLQPSPETLTSHIQPAAPRNTLQVMERLRER